MPDESLPTIRELLKLPRWALVAFAARCARRVLPIVLNSQLSAEQKNSIERAIQIAEKPDAAATTVAAAAAASDAANADDSENTFCAALAAAAAGAAGRAAAAAADNAIVARADMDVANCAHFAAGITTMIDTAYTASILNDFNILKRLAQSEGWDNNTKLPPSVFGDLWPQGEPEWAKIRDIKADKNIGAPCGQPPQ